MGIRFSWGMLALVVLAACSLTSASDKESCAPGGPCGTGTLQVCVTQDSKGACKGTRYLTGNGDSFPCGSCTDCTQAVASATSACSGTGSSSGGSGSGSGGGTGTTCAKGATCANGSSMEVCTTVGADGTCSSIAYTVGLQTFTCAGCTACSTVQSQASQACAGLSGSSSGGSSGGGSGSSSGGSSGGGSGSSSGGSSGSSSGSSGGDASVLTYDGTTGKACASDTDCHAVGGPGVNKCSTSSIYSLGPLFPTPVCIMPSNCDPGTDGNLHFCDGPDASTSPGVCLATGTAGQGVCLPQCAFATDGSHATGCLGKDTCYVAGFSSTPSGGVAGIGYCFGGCAMDTDCPTGSKCQTNEGLCVTTPVTPTAAGTSCNATTTTGAACDCFSSSTTNLGFCANFCSVGGLACPVGSVCETDLPTALVGSNDASVPGWTTQNPGMGGLCVPSCVVDGAAVCPTNSTCVPGTAAGPDCEP